MRSPARRSWTPQLQTAKCLLEQGLQALERPPFGYSATSVCSAPVQDYGRLAPLLLMLPRSQQEAAWAGPEQLLPV